MDQIIPCLSRPLPDGRFVISYPLFGSEKYPASVSSSSVSAVPFPRAPSLMLRPSPTPDKSFQDGQLCIVPLRGESLPPIGVKTCPPPMLISRPEQGVSPGSIAPTCSPITVRNQLLTGFPPPFQLHGHERFSRQYTPPCCEFPTRCCYTPRSGSYRRLLIIAPSPFPRSHPDFYMVEPIPGRGSLWREFTR